MATYKEIQEWIKTNYGFIPQAHLIVEAKRVCGIAGNVAPNRKEPISTFSEDKLEPFKKAFEHFNML